jgi:hypothetical protein
MAAPLMDIASTLTAGGWALTLGAVAIATYVVSSIIAWRRLGEFKGPFLASFSYLWLIRASYSGRMAEVFAKTEAKYGGESPSTVRIGPNELMTSDPEAIRATSAARSKYTRSAWYKFSTVDPSDHAMISVLDTAHHDKLKAQTAAGYAGKDMPGLESEVDLVLGWLVDKIRTKYAAAGPGDKKPMLDLASMTQYFTLDSIAKVSFGEEFGLIREERDIHGHIQALADFAPAAIVIMAIPYFRAVMGSKFVLKLIGPKPQDKKGVGKFVACVSFFFCRPAPHFGTLCGLETQLTEPPQNRKVDSRKTVRSPRC